LQRVDRGATERIAGDTDFQMAYDLEGHSVYLSRSFVIARFLVEDETSE